MKKIISSSRFVFIVIILLFSTAGCSTNIFKPKLVIVAAPSLTPSLTSEFTETPEPTATYTPSLTPTETPSLTPSDTPTITPTWTPSTVPTDTQTPTPTPWGKIPENAVVIYLTIIGSGGPVACGDSLFAINSGFIKSGNVETDITNAVNRLFSIGQYSGGLYNATYPSSLRVNSVELQGKEAVVTLQGSYVKPKDKCDAMRYRDQLWSTIRQFDEVDRAIPRYNGAVLGDLLSAVKGDG